MLLIRNKLKSKEYYYMHCFSERVWTKETAWTQFHIWWKYPHNNMIQETYLYMSTSVLTENPNGQSHGKIQKPS